MCDISQDTIVLLNEYISMQGDVQYAARVFLYNNVPVSTIVISDTINDAEGSGALAIWMAHIVRCHNPFIEGN